MDEGVVQEVGGQQPARAKTGLSVAQQAIAESPISLSCMACMLAGASKLGN